MTTESPSLCTSCTRLRRGGLTCDAFPDGIPDAIRVDGGDHTQFWPGDGGLVYQIDPARAGDAWSVLDWLSSQAG